MEEALTPDSDDSALSDEEDGGGGGSLRGDDEDEAADIQQSKVILPKAISAFLERLPPRLALLKAKCHAGVENIFIP